MEDKKIDILKVTSARGKKWKELHIIYKILIIVLIIILFFIPILSIPKF